VRIRPDYAEVYYNLGIVLENAGRVQEAIRHFEQALRINPGAIEARNKLARLRAVQ
jgi:protein O-mannosyl-transferase